MKSLFPIFVASTVAAVSVTVTIPNNGVVIGTAVSYQTAKPMVNKWQGIPYADSPPAMFMNATTPKPWTSPIMATSFRDACYEQWTPGAFGDQVRAAYDNPFHSGTPKQSADCLYVNIYAPAAAKKSALPVLFWIYGGGLVGGSAIIELYDGTSFAANQDVVVVTFGYRTNVFGFSGSPAAPNNVGLWDQRIALAWVKTNIALFGGDPGECYCFL
jgi:carboxylesterase type B